MSAALIGWMLLFWIPFEPRAWGQNPDQIDSLITAGNRLLRTGDPGHAQEAFERVLKTNRGRIDAMMGMASADIQRERWGKAADWYELIMKKNPDHVPANYGYAVCKREIGKYVGFLQRPGEWRKSEKYFKRVLEFDSTFQDVLFQYAILKRCDEKYETAVDIALRQVAVHPELLEARMGVFKLYDCLISDRPYDQAEAWLKSRSVFYDRYFLGELYRRNGRLDSADSLFTALIQRRGLFPLQPILLSRVRLLVQKNESRQANDAYWQAVRAVAGELDAEFIKQDLIPIVNDEEYTLLRGHTPWPALSNALLPFWFHRDPLPSFPYNHRLIEHYRRLVYAEKNYRFDGIRGNRQTMEAIGYGGSVSMYRAIRTPPWYSENDKFNDMGLIHIRFGEPDNQISTPGQNVVDNASWLYNEKGGMPKMIYHFIRSKSEYWILVSGFSQTEILTNLADWDSRYYRILTEDELGSITLMNEIKMETAKNAEQGLRSDRLTWPKEMRPLDVTSSLFRFRQSEKSDLVQLAYGIPLDKLKIQVTDPDSISIETGVQLFNDRLIPVFKDEHHYLIRRISDSHIHEGLFIDEFELELPLKPHFIAFHSKVTGKDIVNGWRQYLAPGDSGRDRLACSTLKTAFDIRPSGGSENRDRKSLVMVPNPLKTGKRGDPLYIYYEIYNLSLDSKGNAEYNTDFTLRLLEGRKNLFQKLFGGGGKSSISIRNRRTGSARTVADYLGFDVRGAAPGKYELELKILDRNTHQAASSMIVVTIN